MVIDEGRGGAERRYAVSPMQQGVGMGPGDRHAEAGLLVRIDRLLESPHVQQG
jgi:hypothetical protein